MELKLTGQVMRCDDQWTIMGYWTPTEGLGCGCAANFRWTSDIEPPRVTASQPEALPGSGLPVFPKELVVNGWIENEIFCSKHCRVELETLEDSKGCGGNNISGAGSAYFGDFVLSGRISRLNRLNVFTLYATIKPRRPIEQTPKSCYFCGVLPASNPVPEMRLDRPRKRRMLTKRMKGKSLTLDSDKLCPDPLISSYYFLDSGVLKLKFNMVIYKLGLPITTTLCIEQLSEFDSGVEKEIKPATGDPKSLQQRRYFSNGCPKETCDCPQPVCSCCCVECTYEKNFICYEITKSYMENPNANRRLLMFPPIALTKCKQCFRNPTRTGKSFSTYISGFSPGRYLLRISVSTPGSAHCEFDVKHVLVFPAPNPPRNLSALLYKARSKSILPTNATDTESYSFEPVLLASWTSPAFFELMQTKLFSNARFFQTECVEYYCLQLQTKSVSCDDFENFGERIKFLDSKQTKNVDDMHREYNTMIFALPESTGCSKVFSHFRVKVYAVGKFGISTACFSPVLEVPEVVNSGSSLLDFSHCEECSCVICGDEIVFKDEHSDISSLVVAELATPGFVDLLQTRSRSRLKKWKNTGAKIGGRLLKGNLVVRKEMWKLPVSPECCSHLFHLGCILKWAETCRRRAVTARERQPVKCPLCMQTFLEVQQQNLRLDLQDQRDRFHVDTVLSDRALIQKVKVVERFSQPRDEFIGIPDMIRGDSDSDDDELSEHELFSDGLWSDEELSSISSFIEVESFP